MSAERAPPQSRLEALGCRLSEKVADVAAHPYAQVALALVGAAWFAFAWRVDGLTAILSILAITLTQMVLNRQHEREKEEIEELKEAGKVTPLRRRRRPRPV